MKTRLRLNIGLSSHKDLEVGHNNMIKVLESLKAGEESDYLINCGTLRLTLNRIDKARIAIRVKDRDARFIFGKTIVNGQNKFVGIGIKRVS